jgi:hypothetical protein
VQTTGALTEFRIFFGIFVDFQSVWSGLEPICNYFLEAKGPAGIFTNIRGPR